MDKNTLHSKLIELNINQNAYSINGKINDNSYVLYENYKHWEVFYFERGERIDEKIFSNETKACDYLFEILINDPTVKNN